MFAYFTRMRNFKVIVNYFTAWNDIAVNLNR